MGLLNRPDVWSLTDFGERMGLFLWLQQAPKSPPGKRSLFCLHLVFPLPLVCRRQAWQGKQTDLNSYVVWEKVQTLGEAEASFCCSGASVPLGPSAFPIYRACPLYPAHENLL